MSNSESIQKMVSSIPSIDEERWHLRRWLGYTFIFATPHNHWQRWCLLSIHKVHADAVAYLNTL